MKRPCLFPVVEMRACKQLFLECRSRSSLFFHVLGEGCAGPITHCMNLAIQLVRRADHQATSCHQISWISKSKNTRIRCMIREKTSVPDSISCSWESRCELQFFPFTMKCNCAFTQQYFYDSNLNCAKKNNN